MDTSYQKPATPRQLHVGKRPITDVAGQVLAHITRYPGLSLWEIGRATGLIDGQFTNSSAGLMYPIMYLLQDRKVRFEVVRWPAPGGIKHVWYPL